VAILMRSFYPSAKKPTKLENAARQLSNLSSVVRIVPCRHLLVPDALEKLTASAHAINDDLATLETAA
jgi:hypothetical protein